MSGENLEWYKQLFENEIPQLPAEGYEDFEIPCDYLTGDELWELAGWLCREKDLNIALTGKALLPSRDKNDSKPYQLSLTRPRSKIITN